VVTKTPKLGGLESTSACDELQRTFLGSLRKLGLPRAYGLLLHDPADLLGPSGDEIWGELERLRSDGLVERIGASFYEGSDIDEALSRYRLTIVQIPFNALDDRLVKGGQLSRLQDSGVEIHARSLFLQGLLLAERLPPAFEAIAGELERIDQAASAVSLNRLEGLLALAFQQTEISRFICGATNLSEVRQILEAAMIAEKSSPPSYTAGDIDKRILNPAHWSELSVS
jgi:aryl-alcohol dehydrogenase-like predicted oxidoreductase